MRQIDLRSADIYKHIAAGPLYRKDVLVNVRPAKRGEVIQTVLANGLVEVSSKAGQDGDWVVTNPGGEQYLISSFRFNERYRLTQTAGVYQAIGLCRAAPNPFGMAVQVEIAGAVVEKGDKTCFFADTCGPNGNTDGEPYLIGAAELLTTYQPVD